MKGSLALHARRWWSGEAGFLGRVLTVVTAPLEGVYALAVALRDRGWDHRAPLRVNGVRVVSVGNLAVGGTGKTPLAAWVAATLAAAGARPALLTRGYGADEPDLHARWNPDMPVVVAGDRVAGARRARKQGADTVVLDDGFQHRRLARDLDVVLLAAEDAFPGRLLPRGPYREPAGALSRAHHLVVTRRTASAQEAQALARRLRRHFPAVRVSRIWLAPSGWHRLDGTGAEPPSGNVLAVAGIARPDVFARGLEAHAGLRVELLAFRDHHAYGVRDARAIRSRARDRTVVTTEKDAVKLQTLAQALPEDVRVLGQRIVWEEARTGLVDDLFSLAGEGAR